MDIKITTCDRGDWTIVEINGEEVASGHTITTYDWMQILQEHFGVNVTEECISDEEMEMRC